MENQDVKNGITDKRLKENFGNLAISLLVQKKLISASKDLRHLMVEFGYLFLDNRSGPQAMFKLTTPKRFLHPQRTFYFGTQNGHLLLLNEQFTEAAFRKIQHDMFIMHGIDAKAVNPQEYLMDLS